MAEIPIISMIFFHFYIFSFLSMQNKKFKSFQMVPALKIHLQLGNGANSCSKIMRIALSFSFCCAFVSFCANCRTWFSTFSLGSICPIPMNLDFPEERKQWKMAKNIGHNLLIKVSFIILFLAEIVSIIHWVLSKGGDKFF